MAFVRPKSILGRRVELLVDECWVGAPNKWIRKGHQGFIRYSKKYKKYHIVFDKIKPIEDFIFGLGMVIPDGLLKVIERGII